MYCPSFPEAPTMQTLSLAGPRARPWSCTASMPLTSFLGSCSGRSVAGQPALRVAAHQEGEDVANGGLLAGWFGQRKVSLNLIAVAAAVLVLHDIACRGQVRDDAVRASLGDAHRGSDVPQSRTGILRDAQQDPGVIGQETPARHLQQRTTVSSNVLLVFRFGCTLKQDLRRHRPIAARTRGQ